MQTIELIQIGANGIPLGYAGKLNVVVRQVCAATAELYRATGFAPPWVGYLACVDKHLVGACAFKAPPADGKVEIGYLTFPDFEGQGVASLMVAQLLDMVRTKNPSLTVFAQTENEENASNAILKKFGFQFVGVINDAEGGELWQWQWTNAKQSQKQSPSTSHV